MMNRKWLALVLFGGAIACSSSAAENIGPVTCQTDGDCCIADRSCDIILYGVGHPPPESKDTCGCVHPAVQAWCEAGRCKAAKLVQTADAGYMPAPPNWQGSHCGKVAVPSGWTAQQASPMSFETRIEPAYEKFSCSGP